MIKSPVILTRDRARDLWIRAQRLESASPFGEGADATRKAVEHLGYVQIDTINVIERCHHHILFNRIPSYRREHLSTAQTNEKSVFEYWTHALAYVPSKDFRFFMRLMAEHKKQPGRWFGAVNPRDIQRVLREIKKNGALTIRDINGEELVEKTHPWASQKPSKKALEFAFYRGDVVISERIGMLKKYELTDRHFGWQKRPKPATVKEVYEYRLERALRSQTIVSLDSIAYLSPSDKPIYQRIIEKKVQNGELTAVQIESDSKVRLWMPTDLVEAKVETNTQTHLLSPFDPLVIQRKKLFQFFGYEHRFEAYLPKEKRTYGYFALPVLMDNRIVALLDLKTDRAAKKLLIQKWTWLGKSKSKESKMRIEQTLSAFEVFQLQDASVDAGLGAVD